jgi:hypothetical protein
VMKGICEKWPITAKAHKIAETIKTTVDGADRVICCPLVDEWTVIVFFGKARRLLYRARASGRGLPAVICGE